MMDCLQELCRDPIKSRNVDGYGETIKEESNLRNLFLNEANAHKFQVQPGLEMYRNNFKDKWSEL